MWPFRRKEKRKTLTQQMHESPLWTNPETWYLVEYGKIAIQEVLVYGHVEDYRSSSNYIGREMFYCALEPDEPASWHEQGFFSREFYKSSDEALDSMISRANHNTQQAIASVLRSVQLEQDYKKLKAERSAT